VTLGDASVYQIIFGSSFTDVDVRKIRVTRTATNERFWLDVMQHVTNRHGYCANNLGMIPFLID